MTALVRSIAVLGMLVFGTLLAFTWGMPAAVERHAAEFLRERVVAKTSARIEAAAARAGETRLGQLAQRVLKGQEERVARLKDTLKAKASALLATVMVRMQNADCECRAQAAGWLSKGLKLDLDVSTALVGSLERFLYAQYFEVAERLRKELRIFFGSNLAVFTLLLLVALTRGSTPAAQQALRKPALALLSAVLLGSLLYVKGQNWFYTLLHNRWVGWGYLAFLLFAFGAILAGLRGREQDDTLQQR